MYARLRQILIFDLIWLFLLDQSVKVWNINNLLRQFRFVVSINQFLWHLNQGFNGRVGQEGRVRNQGFNERVGQEGRVRNQGCNERVGREGRVRNQGFNERVDQEGRVINQGFNGRVCQEGRVRNQEVLRWDGSLKLHYTRNYIFKINICLKIIILMLFTVKLNKFQDLPWKYP